MPAQRVAIASIKKYFYDNWVDGLANGLPDSNPAIGAIAFGYTPKVHWSNVEEPEKIDKSQHCAVLFTEDVLTNQMTLPGGRNTGSCVRFTTPGVGIIQLFFSKSNYSTEQEELLTAIAHEMFMRAGVDGVTFYRPTIRKLKPEESFFRTNVTFEYEYSTHVQSPTL